MFLWQVPRARAARERRRRRVELTAITDVRPLFTDYDPVTDTVFGGPRVLPPRRWWLR